jgi:hypothetical protein
VFIDQRTRKGRPWTLSPVPPTEKPLQHRTRPHPGAVAELGDAMASGFACGGTSSGFAIRPAIRISICQMSLSLSRRSLEVRRFLQVLQWFFRQIAAKHPYRF